MPDRGRWARGVGGRLIRLPTAAARGAVGVASWFSPPVEEGMDLRLRAGLRRIIVAWAFGSVFFNVTSGAPLAAYVRLLTDSDLAWGIISAAPMLGAVGQLFASFHIERTRRRKPVFLFCGLSHRLLWIPIALLPWFLPPKHALTVAALTLMLVIGGVNGQAVGPAFMSWMSDYVPLKVRGMFFANRMRVGTLMALLSSLIAGALLDLWPRLTTYTLIFMLAAICGAIDILYFRGLPEPPMRPEEEAAPVGRMLSEPFGDPVFRRFLAYAAANSFSISLMGPSLWLFAMEHLNLGKFGANLTLLAAHLAALALVSPLWGRLNDRFGNRPVLRICMGVIALTPIPWIFATPAQAHAMWIVVMVAGAFWAGVELSNFNLMLVLFPKERQTVYLALFALLVGLSAGAAPILGGALIDAAKAAPAGEWWRAVVPGSGPSEPYRMIFVASLVCRLFTALVLLPRVREPGAGSARALLRHVAAETGMSIRYRLRR